MGSERFITITTKPPLGQLLSKYPSKMPAVINDVLNRLGVIGESYMKRVAPVDTGNLRKRITHTKQGTKMYIGTNVTYAPIMLLDTPPFTIRARRKKVLAWVTKGHIRPATKAGWKEARRRGWARFAKQVTHPGGTDAMDKTMDYLERIIPATVSQVLRKFGITTG